MAVDTAQSAYFSDNTRIFRMRLFRQVILANQRISLRQSVLRVVSRFRFWFCLWSRARVHGVQSVLPARRWYPQIKRRDGIENITLLRLPTSWKTMMPQGIRWSPTTIGTLGNSSSEQTREADILLLNTIDGWQS